MRWKRAAGGSSWPLPERARSAPFMVFCKERGRSDWSRRCGPWWRSGDGRSAPAASNFLSARAANFLQHVRIDIAAADDRNVQLGCRELVAVEEEACRRHSSAGLGHGVGIRREQPDRFPNLILGHGYDIVDIAADVLEVDGANALGAQPVGDG